ncbi:hypothetical protein ACWD6R_04080 [Streptomyces sp. NPDC005151]
MPGLTHALAVRQLSAPAPPTPRTQEVLHFAEYRLPTVVQALLTGQPVQEPGPPPGALRGTQVGRSHEAILHQLTGVVEQAEQQAEGAALDRATTR